MAHIIFTAFIFLKYIVGGFRVEDYRNCSLQCIFGWTI